MHICLYTETALPKLGGQELVVDALARHLQAAGGRVTVLAARPRRRWIVDDSQLPYRVVRHWPLFSTHRLVDWYRHALTRLYRRDPWDVLHCHSTYPCGYLASLAGAALPTPVVITSHGGDVRAGNARLSKPGMDDRFRRAIERADALIAISRFTSDAFRRLGARDGQVVSIPNGVDLTPFRQPVARPTALDESIQSQRYLLFIGRLHRRKGVDVALEALAQSPARGGVELVIAGSGDERTALMQRTQALNLGERVRFVGSVAGDVKTYLLQNARAVVIPSRTWEAFPLVVLEAFAAGVPCIGTQIPGLGDLIVNDRNGWLAAPDSVDSLAPLLQQALHGDTCEALRPLVRIEAERYAWSNIASEHIQLYQRLIERRAQRAAG
ncbi:MAG: glycosyltransferase family 4 protein [Planctomycetaceae bacterium]|nr:glycosyltransferase family 4 protein [Planctomycetaceae bacterium]